MTFKFKQNITQYIQKHASEIKTAGVAAVALGLGVICYESYNIGYYKSQANSTTIDNLRTTRSTAEVIKDDESKGEIADNSQQTNQEPLTRPLVPVYDKNIKCVRRLLDDRNKEYLLFEFNNGNNLSLGYVENGNNPAPASADSLITRAEMICQDLDNDGIEDLIVTFNDGDALVLSGSYDNNNNNNNNNRGFDNRPNIFFRR